MHATVEHQIQNHIFWSICYQFKDSITSYASS